MPDDKKRRLVELDVHRRKLSVLVGDLLQKADELDKESQPLGKKLDAEWHRVFTSTCQELALLSEAIAQLEPVVKQGKVKVAEEALIRSAHIAHHLSERLKNLKQQAHQC